MTNATAIWRIRPSGSNTNGGGYDPGIGGAGTDYSQQNAAQASGTHGSCTSADTSTTSNSIPGSAFGANLTFTTGTSLGLSANTPVAIFYTTTPTNYVQGTVVTDVTTSLVITPTGTPGAAGPFTAWTICTSTTFVDATANAFTSAMVGNAIYITGTNFITGWYFVTGYTSASTVTLDRPPGYGSTATWHLGGGWADPFTNMSTPNQAQISYSCVGGNTFYILGTGTPNAASYSYDYNWRSTGYPCGGSGIGYTTIAGDPATPGYLAPPNCSGGMPCIKANNSFGSNIIGNYVTASGSNPYIKIQGIWFVLTTSQNMNLNSGSSPWIVEGVVFDQFANDANAYQGSGIWIGGEIFSSVAPGANGSNYAINLGYPGLGVYGVNIHDIVGNGISAGNQGAVIGCVIAKCRGNGVYINTGGGGFVLAQNTIDGNLGSGILINTSGNVNNLQQSGVIYNNIISNHTQASTYGISSNSGTAAVNTAVAPFIDYNVYYGNTTDFQNLNYGPHDTHGGSNPYVAQPTENYTLA
jgi:hypothetical protein